MRKIPGGDGGWNPMGQKQKIVKFCEKRTKIGKISTEFGLKNRENDEK
ncbi:hypothetical protein [Diplocloster modestus]|uniref:Uncharacterized protein n=1 Tax=Diplocloster modestus TaxID=2850322 RepID=A0ABS6K9S7_9FIRM|nr:hypothetical protein [Diplocloster modestus]MBU9727255.1 hypothetical protein [Diplocloster modestus]